MQTTSEAVDGSRFGSFFVKFVPLGNCSGVERFLVWTPRCTWTCTGGDLVRGSAGIRDEVGTAMRPWTILNTVVSLWFFRRCSRVGHCSFSSIIDTLLWCLWSPDTMLNCCSTIYPLHVVDILLEMGVPHCNTVLQGRPRHCQICHLLRLFWAVL